MKAAWIFQGYDLLRTAAEKFLSQTEKKLRNPVPDGLAITQNGFRTQEPVVCGSIRFVGSDQRIVDRRSAHHWGHVI